MTDDANDSSDNEYYDNLLKTLAEKAGSRMGRSTTSYRHGSIRGTLPAYSPPTEQLATTDERDYLRDKLTKTESKSLSRERILSKQLTDLNAENAKKDLQIKYYKDNRFFNNCVNFVNIILVGIGASLLGADFKDNMGWLLIAVGAILFILTLIKPNRGPPS